MQVEQLIPCGTVPGQSSSGGTYKAFRFLARTDDGKLVVMYLDEASQIRLVPQAAPAPASSVEAVQA